LHSIEKSQRYLSTRRAAADYRRQYHATGITRSRVQRSLQRFAQLLRVSHSAGEFEAAVRREFVLYRPVPIGAAAFTGYYRPVITASRARTATYRYPLYQLPRLSRWPRPHPTRAQLEGTDGLQPSRYLRGRELVWLRDRLDAFLVQVQGSAQLRLTDGRSMTIGYAGTTAWPYTSVGRELVKDGKMSFAELTLPALVAYFRNAPEELDKYLPRNRRFVFFRETRGAPASGSIGVSLTPERSIATDKRYHPPGALARIEIHVTNPDAARVLKSDTLTRYVLDQDTGTAIKGAGRVDVFMGTGAQAEQRAGVINSRGNLAYLLLRK
jgi:membrane-bound lytic murein transglycosylase A